MKSDEKISLLIANYNNGKYLEECLQSIFDQTSDRWEIVIVDDCSTDTSHEIYKKYSGHDNIKILKNHVNKGYIESLKILIDNAKNDIVGIIDPDDKLEITCIEDFLEYYDSHPEAAFVYSNFWFCDENLKPQRPGFCRALLPGKTNLDMNVISHFKTFRKSVYYKTEGYDNTLLYAEDKDLSFKLEELTSPRFINKSLYYYRELQSSQSHGKKSKISKSNFDLAKKKAKIRRGIKKNRLYSLFNIKPKVNPYLVPIKKDIGIDNLISARNILQDLNMRYWLTDGTLLGYYRDGDFIKHDFDLDIGSTISDFNDKIFLRFIEDGWTLDNVFGNQDIGLEISFRREHIRLDIFFFYNEKDKLWHGAWEKTQRGFNLIKYYYDPFSLKTIDFLGYIFNIPDNTEQYLITKYGKEWKTPIKDWDWAFGPENAVETDIYFNTNFI